MTRAGVAGRRRWPFNVVFARPRLFVSILIGLAVGILLPLLFSDLPA